MGVTTPGRGGQATFLAVAATASLLFLTAAVGRQAYAGPAQADLRAAVEAACGSLDPYFAAARYPSSLNVDPAEPAVVAFRAGHDGPADAQEVLATQSQVGSVYGLAYDGARGLLYAAAYHKRGVRFGPSGPGGIYRVDLYTGRVTRWATLWAGSDQHDFRRNPTDQAAAEVVGLTSLGDITLDDDGQSLFVANLQDARIYRLATRDGTVQGSFSFAAAREPWAFTARPIGLTFRDGWLYHAVLDTSHTTESGAAQVHVYRSLADGSAMSEVASGRVALVRDSFPPRGVPQPPQPAWVAGIEVLPDGRLVLGLRDSAADALLGRGSWVGERVLLVTPGARPDQPAVMDADHLAVRLDSPGALGGLALIPGRLELLAAVQPRQPADRTASYQPRLRVLDIATGRLVREAVLASGASLSLPVGYGETYVTGLGDVEPLCPRDRALAPGAEPTATARSEQRATATAVAAGTKTAVARATATAAAKLRAPTETAAAETATAQATLMAPTRTALAVRATVTVEWQRTVAVPTLTAAVPSRTAEAARVAPTLTAQATGAMGAATERAAREAPTLTAQARAGEATVAAWPTAGVGTATARARQTGGAASPTADSAAIAPTLTAVAATLTAQAPTRGAMATSAAATEAAAATAAPERAAEAERTYRRIVDACDTDNPFLAVTRFVPGVDWSMNPFDPAALAHSEAVIAFHDSLLETAYDRATLAWQPDVGATYGLAYDWRRGQIYAASYLKRLAHYGPGGPGAIYRIDLRTGAAVVWSRLDAGPDVHALHIGFDETAAYHVGKLGLGDIDLTPAGDELLVVNLADRLIYRLSVPDGVVRGFFPHGAAGQPWAADARPFGLGVRGDWLYHGVVDSRELLGSGTEPGDAVIYRSRPDGSQMGEVGRLPLSYSRSATIAPWSRWTHGGSQTQASSSGAMLSDIEFTLSGALLMGLRNRLGDGALYRAGDGDLVPSVWLNGLSIPLPVPEHYPDTVIYDESTWGSLAALPGRDVVVSTFLDPWVVNSGGAVWYDNTSGRMIGRETVYVNDGTSPTFAKTSGLGDLEVLCPPALDPPTPTASATATPTAGATATPSATPSATPRTYVIYLPLALRAACTPQLAYADVALVIDVSTSMRRDTLDGRRKLAAVQAAAGLFVQRLRFPPDARGGRDQVAVVGFNNDAWIEQPLTADAAAVRAAIDRLPAGMKEGTRLDLALEWGRRALEDPARVATSTPVMVLLTDGMPNRVPPAEDGAMETTVLRAAAAAKQAGILIYTVGVGLPDAPDLADRINIELLRDVATRPDMAYHTFRSSELERIYGEIARAVVCPPERQWPVP